MRIAVLGPLEVRTDDDVPVVVPGAKERLLLAALAAAAPAAVSADGLAETLWDGDAPPSARKSLQAHVVRLRSALEPGRPKGSTGRFVVRRGPGYALAVERRELDALHMTDLAVRGRAHLASGDPAAAATELRAALALWRGQAYADWPDAGFAHAERRRLDEVRAAALTSSVEADLEQGQHSDLVPELERLVAEEPLREAWWRLLMLALYRAGRQGDALAVGRRARAVLAEELGADPGPALRDMEAAVLAQDAQLDPPSGTGRAGAVAGAPTVAVCPYKGLAVYEADDVLLFHGRDRVVARLVGRTVDSALVLVSGPSGAGKSSVVRAGLVPALRQGAVPGSGAWLPLVVTPGGRPVDALAELTGESPPGAPVVLVVDQFEELWAPRVDAAERRAFLDAVVGLLDDGLVVRCIAVVRGDHVGRLAEHTAFADRLGTALVLVPTPTDAELREIVTAPATAVGLTVEPGLVDAVTADVLGRAGALPLLSTALVGTWERREGGRLTLAGYLQAGGVTGALAASAEAAYSSLDPAAREAARPLLLRLADVDDTGALVRRPVPLAELDLDGDGGAGRREVVESFVRRRLLALDGERLDVAHEALLSAWPRLARWLEDDAAGRAVRRHLAPAAREWERLGRPVEELYGGARLAAAAELLTEGPGDLTPVEVRFLEASSAHADAELRAAVERAEREGSARRRTRRLAAGLAVVLVLALVAAGLAAYFQQAADARAGEAERTSRIADANRLAALADASASLDLGVLLAAQGFRLADTPETRSRLLDTLAENPRVVQVAPAPATIARALLVGDGESLFLATENRLSAWDVLPGAVPEEIRQVFVDRPEWPAVDASPTETLLAAGGRAYGESWLSFIGRDGTERSRSSAEALGGAPVGLSFTPDGLGVRVLVADADRPGGRTAWRLVTVDPVDGSVTGTGTAGSFPETWLQMDADFSVDTGTAVLSSGRAGAPPVLLDLTGGREVPLAAPERDAEVLGYRALDSGAAQLWDDGEVVLFDRSGAVVQRLGEHRAAVRDVVPSPDGTWGATVGDGGAVIVWDVEPGTGRWRVSERLAGHGADVVEAEIDQAGERLVTAAPGESVIAWDVVDDAFGEDHPVPPGRRLTARPAVVDPGRLLVAPTVPAAQDAGSERPVAATFIDPRDGAVVAEVPVGRTVADARPGAFAAVSPDRRLVAVTAGLRTAIVDTRTRRVVERVRLPADGDRSADGTELSADLMCCSAWTPDGSRLLIATEDNSVVRSEFGEIAVIDTATWQEEMRLNANTSPRVIRTSPDGRWIVVAGAGRNLTALDTARLGIEASLQLDEPEEITDIAFAPDGRSVVSVGSAGLLRLFETGTLSATAAVPLPRGPGTQVEWLADGRTVLTAGADGSVSVVDVERPLIPPRPLASPGGPPGEAHLVPDPSDEVVVLRSDGTGHRYPMDPAVWLRDACSMVGRDLSREEWARYVPGRPYQRTCSDLG